MRYTNTINRQSQFAVSDLVTLDPSKTTYLNNEFACKSFFEHEPVKVLEVEAITRCKPYFFRYFLENDIGERMFLEGRYLLLMTKMGNDGITVPEESTIESKYNINDVVTWKDSSSKSLSGKVIDVRVAKTNNGLPYFTYLIEFENRTRKLYRESVLI